MTTTLFIYILTLSSTKLTEVHYSNHANCQTALSLLAVTLDKLNETTNLGYSLQCKPSSKS